MSKNNGHSDELERKRVEMPTIGDNLENVGAGDLKRAEISAEDRKKYEEIFDKSRWQKFKKQIKRTWQGKNDTGKIIGFGLDIGELFVPQYVARLRDQLQSKQGNKTMLKKILSIKNFINLKDENGNFSWQELGASLLQIVLAGAIVWGAMELGIWDQLIKLLSNN